MRTTTVLCQRTFPNQRIISESSMATRDLGTTDVTVIVYARDNVISYVDIDFGKYGYESLGVTFEGKKVVDYEGMYSFPSVVAELLTELGYDCSEIE